MEAASAIVLWSGANLPDGDVAVFNRLALALKAEHPLTRQHVFRLAEQESVDPNRNPSTHRVGLVVHPFLGPVTNGGISQSGGTVVKHRITLIVGRAPHQDAVPRQHLVLHRARFDLIPSTLARRMTA